MREWRSFGNGPENEQDFDIGEGDASLKWRREQSQKPRALGGGGAVRGGGQQAVCSPVAVQASLGCSSESGCHCGVLGSQWKF